MTTDVVPVLRVADAATSASWYERLGFARTFEHRFEPHLPAYVGLRREDAQIHLSEHTGDAPLHGLVFIWVDDIDTIAADLGASVVERPWARELEVSDPDGNRLRLAQYAGTPGVADVFDDGAEERLLELERSMWTDATRRDRAWMDQHLSGDFTEFGWSGRRYTRADILDLEIDPIEVELADFDVRPVGGDAALVTYRSVQGRGAGNRASLWVRSRRRWRLAFHQGTPTD